MSGTARWKKPTSPKSSAKPGASARASERLPDHNSGEVCFAACPDPQRDLPLRFARASDRSPRIRYATHTIPYYHGTSQRPI